MAESQTDRVYVAINQAIIDGSLPPGAVLSEGDLARTYGTSRTPVREALTRLLAEGGLVERVHNRGYTVARLSMKQLQDVFNIRRLLEAESARLAATGDPDLATLRRYAQYRYAVHDAASYREAMDQNTRFHLSIAEASGNSLLTELLGYCLSRMTRFLTIGVRLPESARKATHEEHLKLVDAIEAKDPERAAELVRAHLDRTLGLMLAELVSSARVALR